MSTEIKSIHNPFVAWLKAEGICYLRARSDKRSTISPGWPDFSIFVAGRALFIECKDIGGKLSADQQLVHDQLRKAGMTVRIAFSLQDCVDAVLEWSGVINRTTGLPQASMGQPHNLTVPFAIDAPPKPEWICTVMGRDWVCTGSTVPGEVFTKVRNASPQDLRELPRS